jgi:hypothetical protein
MASLLLLHFITINSFPLLIVPQSIVPQSIVPQIMVVSITLRLSLLPFYRGGKLIIHYENGILTETDSLKCRIFVG